MAPFSSVATWIHWWSMQARSGYLIHVMMVSAMNIFRLWCLTTKQYTQCNNTMEQYNVTILTMEQYTQSNNTMEQYNVTILTMEQYTQCNNTMEQYNVTILTMEQYTQCNNTMEQYQCNNTHNVIIQRNSTQRNNTYNGTIDTMNDLQGTTKVVLTMIVYVSIA